MNDGKITEIVSPEVYKQIESLIKGLNDSYAALQNNVKAAIELNKSFTGNSTQQVKEYEKVINDTSKANDKFVKTQKELVQTQESVQKALDDSVRILKEQTASRDVLISSIGKGKVELINIRKELKTLQKEFSAAKISPAQYAKSLGEVTARQTEVQASLSSYQKQLKDQIKQDRLSIGSLNQKAQSLKQLKDLYRNLGADDLAYTEQTQKIVDTINVLDKEVKTTSASIGEYNRNVGDYTNGIIRALGQTRIFGGEMGGFFQTVRQGIVILKGLEAAHHANAVAAGKATKATNTFRSALLRTGIGALVVALGYLIANWKEVTEFMSTDIKLQNQINEVNKQAVQIYGEQVAKINLIEKTLKSSIASDKQKEQAVRDLNGMLDGQAKSLNDVTEAEKWLEKNKDNYITMIKEKARAQAAADLLAKEQVRIIELQMNQEKLAQDLTKKGWESVTTFLENKFSSVEAATSFIDPTVSALIKTGEELDNANKKANLLSDFIIKANENATKAGEDAGVKSKAQADEERKLLEIRTQNIRNAYQRQRNEILISYNQQIKDNATFGAVQAALRVQMNQKLADLDREYRNEQEKAIIDGTRKIASAENALQMARLNRQRDEQNRIVEDDKRGYDERILAFEQYENTIKEIQYTTYENQKTLRQQQLDDELKALKNNLDKGELTEDQYNKRSKAAQDAYDTDIETLEVEHQGRLNAIVADGIKKRESLLSNFSELEKLSKPLFEQEKATQALIDEQYNQLKRGEINLTEYNRNVKKINEQGIQESIDIQIEYFQWLLDNTELSETQRLDIQKRIWALTNQARKADQDKELANFKSLEEKKKELAKATYDAIRTLVGYSFDNRINKLKEEADAVDERAEREKKAIEEGLYSEEEKAARIKIIESQAQADRENIEKKQKKAQRDKAKADKAFALMESIINTGVSITKTAATLGFPAAIPFIAIAAALGAIQQGLIAAQPIPQYAEGTDYHKGGLAVVGDGGQKEYGILPSGKVFETPAIPTLVDLPKGTEVLPDFNSFVKAVGVGALPSDKGKVENIIVDFKREAQHIVDAIKNQEKMTLNITSRGIEALMNIGGNKKSLRNSSFRN